MSGVAESDRTTVTSAAADVAVIVVSGVGDDALGGGRDAVVDALAQDPSDRWKTNAGRGQITLVASADTGDTGDDNALRTGVGGPNLREPFPVPTANVASFDEAPAVDVYEMHWADLSRAQGPVQRLFYLLFAITMQVATIGLEAVRRYAENTGREGTRPLRYLQISLNAMSYWLAYVITPLVVAQAALSVVVNLELLTRPTEVASWVLVVAAAPAFAGAAWWIAGRTYSGGWTFDRIGKPWGLRTAAPDDDDEGNRSLWITVALTVALVLTTLWFGIADNKSLAAQLAYLFAIATVATAVGTRAAYRGARTDDTVDPKKDRRQARRVIQGAYAAIPIGALLLVILNTPRQGGAAVRTANALTAIAMGTFRLAWLVMLVMCTTITAFACWLRFAPAETEDEQGDRRKLSATVMLSVMLGPLLYALATSAMFLVFSAVSRIYPDYAKTWPDGLPRCPGPTIMDPVIDCTSSSLSTVEWGEGLVRATVQPLGLAMLLIAVLVSLIGIFFAGYISSFRARGQAASAVDPSIKQGKAFSDGLDQTGHSRLFATVLVPLVVLTTLAAIAFWTIGPGDLERFGREKFSSIAFPLAFILAVLAVAGVGLKNVGFIGKFGGGFLKVLALVLDVIYDITTYLRVANPAIVAPRIRMIARYRAVLAHLHAQGYAHVVIMAHSQGSVLSLATLLGDPDRTPPVTPAPPEATPPTITLLTYGCPATQTYARRFPTQFTIWQSGGPSIDRWLNVYRAGDYVGRSIVAPDDYDPRDVNPPDGVGQANRQERCLGPGHHTGYFTDERWRRVARHVVATPCPASLADVDLGDLTVAKLDGPPSAGPGDPTVELPGPAA